MQSQSCSKFHANLDEGFSVTWHVLPDGLKRECRGGEIDAIECHVKRLCGRTVDIGWSMDQQVAKGFGDEVLWLRRWQNIAAHQIYTDLVAIALLKVVQKQWPHCSMAIRPLPSNARLGCKCCSPMRAVGMGCLKHVGETGVVRMLKRLSATHSGQGLLQ